MSSVLIYLVIGALIIFRYSRPMKIGLTRLFVAPAVLLLISALNIYGTEMLFPAPAWSIAAAVAIGIALGVPVGVFSTAHRTVRRTEKPHVMYVDPSWITAAIWIGAFIVKALIRSSFHTGATATVVGDGLLLFGISAVLASYWVIYRKFRALDQQPQPA